MRQRKDDKEDKEGEEGGKCKHFAELETGPVGHVV